MTELLDDARGELLAWHNRFVGWVESWVSNPVSSYSVYALDGLFGLTRDKIARLREIEARPAPVHQCEAEPRQHISSVQHNGKKIDVYFREPHWFEVQVNGSLVLSNGSADEAWEKFSTLTDPDVPQCEAEPVADDDLEQCLVCGLVNPPPERKCRAICLIRGVGRAACRECGEADPCDDRCPNYQDAAPLSRSDAESSGLRQALEEAKEFIRTVVPHVGGHVLTKIDAALALSSAYREGGK